MTADIEFDVRIHGVFAGRVVVTPSGVEFLGPDGRPDDDLLERLASYVHSFRPHAGHGHPLQSPALLHAAFAAPPRKFGPFEFLPV